MNKHFLSLLTFIALLVQYVPAKAQENQDWLNAYLLPGERVVTLMQRLSYNGREYQIHYFTTGDLNIADSRFIALASPQYFKQHKVTVLLVSSENRVVTDEEVIEQVLLLYRAAHYLYVEEDEPMFYEPASLAEEMQRFTSFPVFLQFWETVVKNTLFNSRKDEYEEAMRGILSTQLKPPDTIQLWIDRTMKLGESTDTLSEASDEAIAIYKLDKDRRVRRLAGEVEKKLGSWQKKTGYSVKLLGRPINLFNALDLFSLLSKMIWITDMQKDRAEELASFTRNARGDAAFDLDMADAYSEIAVEVENAWAQRGQIVLDFLQQYYVELEEQVGTATLAALYRDKMYTLARWRISGYALVHSVSLGYLIGDLLFGINDTYHHFLIGARTDELRKKFHGWRLSLLERNRIQSKLIFDGEQADQYRAAYMLEAYATARVYRLYADGVAASARSGIINKLKELGGEEYSEAGEDLRQTGIKIETDAEETLGYPSLIDEAQRLFRNRLLLLSLTVDDASAGFSRQGKSSYWMSLPVGYAGQSLWTYNQAGETANSATWTLTLLKTGRYLVQAYIPASSEEVKKPYSATARYTITYAWGTAETILDQAGKSGRWADLGIYTFNGAAKAKVRLEDLTGELQGESAVVFDAVRFIPEDQMVELLQGEPFNVERALQEMQIQAQNWWDQTSNQVERSAGQWWAEQQDQIKKSFDPWWEKQQQKLVDAVDKWWQDVQQQAAQWLERQFTEWLNQCLGSIFLPFGLLAGVWVARRRRGHD